MFSKMDLIQQKSKVMFHLIKCNNMHQCYYNFGNVAIIVTVVFAVCFVFTALMKHTGRLFKTKLNKVV